MGLQVEEMQMQPDECSKTRIQRDRELQLVRRAEQALSTSESRLRALHKESALHYGAGVFSVYEEAVTDRLKIDLEEFAADPGKARHFASVFPYFDGFKSPEQIAAVALIAAIDQFSSQQRLISYAQGLSTAIEAESRLLKLEGKCPADIYQLLKIIKPKQLIKDKNLLLLGVIAPKWDREAKANVGLYLAHLIQEATGLIDIKLMMQHGRRHYEVEASESAIRLAQSIPRRAVRASHGPMVCQPRPWDKTLVNGGMLTNTKSLIVPPIQDQFKPWAMDPWLTADISKQISAVNTLQAVPLVMDKEMVGLQRSAWEGGLPGLFPCSRTAPAFPERIGGENSIEAWKIRKLLESAAIDDRQKNKNRRIKIERYLQTAEWNESETVWQSWMMDSRGRTYPTNRGISSQGTDQEKAILGFKPELVSAEGFDWLFINAAGHSHLSRGSWEERLQWGKENVELIKAAANDPLNRTELWRSTDHPWQYLQSCKSIRDALEGKPTGSPIRFDQTTSGCGILAALIRDKRIGRSCNLWGSTRHDLYSEVAAKVHEQLLIDLEDTETKFAQENANFWLDHGIDRQIMKTPVMAVPYGGGMTSISNLIISYLLDEKHIPVESYCLQVAFPARYLARIAYKEIKKLNGSTVEVKRWLMDCCRLILQKGMPLEYTGPLGWPMRAAERICRTKQIKTFYYGAHKSLSYSDAPIENELNAAASNKAIGANLVHSLDAALAHAVIYECGNQQIELLPNHDCFACHPSNATALHNILLTQTRALYASDILGDMHIEMQNRTRLSLPKPPMVNDLNPAMIGENTYLFS